MRLISRNCISPLVRASFAFYTLRARPLCGLETAMRAEKLTLDDVRALANALANNTILTTLNLQCTDSAMHW
jgi:hypothetical protein